MKIKNYQKNINITAHKEKRDNLINQMIVMLNNEVNLII
jgi:hypothetical protein